MLPTKYGYCIVRDTGLGGFSVPWCRSSFGNTIDGFLMVPAYTSTSNCEASDLHHGYHSCENGNDSYSEKYSVSNLSASKAVPQISGEQGRTC